LVMDKILKPKNSKTSSNVNRNAENIRKNWTGKLKNNSKV
jgi:hypothetical protein